MTILTCSALILLTQSRQEELTQRTLDYVSRCQEIIKTQLETQGPLILRNPEPRVNMRKEYKYEKGINFIHDLEEVTLHVQGAQAVYQRNTTGLFGDQWILKSLWTPPTKWQVAGQDPLNALTPEGSLAVEAQILPQLAPPLLEKVERWKLRSKVPALGWRGVACGSYPFIRVDKTGVVSFGIKEFETGFRLPQWLKQGQIPNLKPFDEIRLEALASYMKFGPHSWSSLAIDGPVWQNLEAKEISPLHPAQQQLNQSSKLIRSQVPVYRFSFTAYDEKAVSQVTVRLDALLGKTMAVIGDSESLSYAIAFPEIKKLELPSSMGEKALVFTGAGKGLKDITLGERASATKQTIGKPHGLLILKSFDVFPFEFDQGYIRIPYGVWRVKAYD